MYQVTERRAHLPNDQIIRICDYRPLANTANTMVFLLIFRSYTQIGQLVVMYL